MSNKVVVSVICVIILIAAVVGFFAFKPSQPEKPPTPGKDIADTDPSPETDSGDQKALPESSAPIESAPISNPPVNPKEPKEKEAKPFTFLENDLKGILIAGGQYVPPPYQIEVKDQTVLLGGIEIADFSPPAPEEISAAEKIEAEKQLNPASKGINTVCTYDLMDKINQTDDLYGLDKAKEELTAILDKAKTAGQIHSYNIKTGQGVIVAFFDEKGMHVKDVFFRNPKNLRLGPPYKKVDLSDKSFNPYIVGVVSRAYEKYPAEVALQIASNLIDSQPSVSDFKIVGHNIMIRDESGKELKLAMKLPDKSKERLTLLGELKRNATRKGQRYISALNENCLVIINKQKDAEMIIPSPKGIEVFLGLCNDIINNSGKIKPVTLEAIPDIFHQEIKQNLSVTEEVRKRFK